MRLTLPVNTDELLEPSAARRLEHRENFCKIRKQEGHAEGKARKGWMWSQRHTQHCHCHPLFYSVTHLTLTK
jgi:hypothetical protein